jgi:hypothetical protein
MTRRRWTDAERGVLRDEFLMDTPAQMIADRLGRSVGAVKNEAWAQGLRWRDRPRPLRPFPASLREEIEAARREAPTAPLFRPGDRL